MDALLLKFGSLGRKAAEAMAPDRPESSFLTDGKISPEEFVRACDAYIHNFPMWQWGTATKKVKHLPEDKQFLYRSRVPRNDRLDDVACNAVDAGNNLSDSGNWNSLDDANRRPGSSRAGPSTQGADAPSRPVYEEEDDGATCPVLDAPPTNTYTLYITYSKRFGTPRLFIEGENGLSAIDASRDLEIHPDYEGKTVTVEDFPHFSNKVPMVYIHPCKHSEVMKHRLDILDQKLSREREAENAKREQERKNQRGLDDVDEDLIVIETGQVSAIEPYQYIDLFLRMVAGMVPHLNIDFAAEM